MEPDRGIERRFRPAHAGDVIQMRVGEEDVFHVQLAPADQLEQLVHLVARVDADGFLLSRAAHDESVLAERRGRSGRRRSPMSLRARIFTLWGRRSSMNGSR